MESIADRLERVRKDAEIDSHSELWRRLDRHGLDVSRVTVNDYQSGRTVPNVEYIIAICELLDVSPEWLLTGEGERVWARGDRAAQRRGIITAWLEEQVREYAERKTYDPIPRERGYEGENNEGDGRETATR